MAMNREIKNQQEASWAVEQKVTRDKQLVLQDKQTRIQEEQTKIQRAQLKLSKLQEENKIMLMDLSNCTDVAKEYFLGLQNEIIERRCSGATDDI